MEPHPDRRCNSGCYLRLGNVSELPNAVQRLANCESKFVSSYGANLERVRAVKGHTGQEAVLLVRMHLLQACFFTSIQKDLVP